MKHNWKITGILLLAFLLAQFIGIGVLYKYIDPVATQETGKMTFEELPFVERPDVEEDTSYLPVMIAIILGTVLLLLLIKYNLTWVWKGWFLIAVFISLGIAFSAFIPAAVAFTLAAILAIWKVFKPNLFVHTGTELFIYGGLAAIFVPVFNVFSMSILLVLIMIYDAYAVWKSKHMITLAKSQSKQKLFAGLLIPYSLAGMKSRKFGKKIKTKGKKKKVPQKKVRTAMLGGEDIGFPLLYAGVVLKAFGLWQAFLISFCAMIGLAVLMYMGEEKKFYPAMPFIGVGCFVGLGIVWLATLL